MPADVARLFDEWAAAAARGEHPDTLAYLRRAGDAADELATLIESYRRAAPAREPDEQTLALTRAWMAGESPLAVLRARRSLRRDQVVEAIEREFALPESKRPKLKDAYHRLEAGLLDPARVSGRLVDLLARLFETTPETLRAWRARPLEASPAFRAAETAPAASFERTSLRRVERDEVDELFGIGS